MEELSTNYNDKYVCAICYPQISYMNHPMKDGRFEHKRTEMGEAGFFATVAGNHV